VDDARWWRRLRGVKVSEISKHHGRRWGVAIAMLGAAVGCNAITGLDKDYVETDCFPPGTACDGGDAGEDVPTIPTQPYDSGDDGTVDGGVLDAGSSTDGALEDACPHACDGGCLGDIRNCGACGVDCTTLTNVNSPTGITCSGGTTCEVPPSSCKPGWASCPGGDAGPGCTTPVNTEGRCGACGHSCQGGKCDGEVCQPVTLASSQREPWGISVDGPYVYWTNSVAAIGSVAKVPLDGGVAVTVSPSSFGYYGLAVTPTNIYCTDGFPSDVVKLLGAGGFTVASGPAYLVVADAKGLYWTGGTGKSGLVKGVP
jgi:hypothetical protein